MAPQRNLQPPYKIFINSAEMIVDGSGVEYWKGRSNQADVTGEFVWRRFPDGRQEIALPPLGTDAYGDGFLQVMNDGSGWFFSMDGSGTRITGWQLPEFIPLPARTGTVQAPTPSSSGSDMVARDTANRALALAQQAMDRANYAKDLASNALARPEGVSEARVGEIAWTKAGDRFAAIWNEMLDYNVRPQLLSVIWNHGIQLLEFAKLITPGSIRKNPADRLRM